MNSNKRRDEVVIGGGNREFAGLVGSVTNGHKRRPYGFTG